MAARPALPPEGAPGGPRTEPPAPPRLQVLRFGGVGVLGFLVNAGLVEALARDLGPGPAQLLAFPVAATATWWLNRRFTFRASGKVWHREWLLYLAANGLGWLANNGTYFLAIALHPPAHRHPALAVAAGSLAGMTFNFLLSRRLVF